jgi:hypothetical protein
MALDASTVLLPLTTPCLYAYGDPFRLILRLVLDTGYKEQNRLGQPDHNYAITPTVP